MDDLDFHIRRLEDAVDLCLKGRKLLEKSLQELDNGGGQMPLKRLESAVGCFDDVEEILTEQLDQLVED